MIIKVKNDHRSKFSNKQLERRSLKKIRASTGFEPVTSALPVRCSTNWAMKPHIGSEVNLLSSYLPWGVKWWEVYEIIHFWTAVEDESDYFIYFTPSISHFQTRVIARRRKARFPLCISRILFAAKLCWTALHLSRPLFVGSHLQVTWWALGQWKERKICFEW